MSMQLYKPNSNNKGHAVGMSFNSKEQKLYVQFIKQTSWDANSKKGTFKGGRTFNISLGAAELGAVLNVIEQRTTEKLFHSSEKGDTSITIKPFLGKNDVENGFSISANPRGGDEEISFGFWFNNSESRLLKEYLLFVLYHFFSADYSEDKQRRAEAFKKKAAEKTGEPAAEPEPEPEAEPDGDPFA